MLHQGTGTVCEMIASWARRLKPEAMRARSKETPATPAMRKPEEKCPERRAVARVNVEDPVPTDTTRSAQRRAGNSGDLPALSLSCVIALDLRITSIIAAKVYDEAQMRS
jgi:hypothetical protein